MTASSRFLRSLLVAVQFLVPILQFLVDGGQLFIGGLQLLLGGSELLIGGLQFFVGAARLLVGGPQFLGMRLVLLRQVAQILARLRSSRCKLSRLVRSTGNSDGRGPSTGLPMAQLRPVKIRPENNGSPGSVPGMGVTSSEISSTSGSPSLRSSTGSLAHGRIVLGCASWIAAAEATPDSPFAIRSRFRLASTGGIEIRRWCARETGESASSASTTTASGEYLL